MFMNSHSMLLTSAILIIDANTERQRRVGEFSFFHRKELVSYINILIMNPNVKAKWTSNDVAWRTKSLYHLYEENQ